MRNIFNGSVGGGGGIYATNSSNINIEKYKNY